MAGFIEHLALLTLTIMMILIIIYLLIEIVIVVLAFIGGIQDYFHDERTH